MKQHIKKKRKKGSMLFLFLMFFFTPASVRREWLSILEASLIRMKAEKKAFRSMNAVTSCSRRNFLKLNFWVPFQRMIPNLDLILLLYWPSSRRCGNFYLLSNGLIKSIVNKANAVQCYLDN